MPRSSQHRPWRWILVPCIVSSALLIAPGPRVRTMADGLAGLAHTVDRGHEAAPAQCADPLPDPRDLATRVHRAMTSPSVDPRDAASTPFQVELRRGGLDIVVQNRRETKEAEIGGSVDAPCHEWSYRLCEVRAGDDLLFDAPSGRMGEPGSGPGLVAYSRADGLYEVYEPSTRGVEQSWLLDAAPRSEADLVFVGQVATDLLARVTEDGAVEYSPDGGQDSTAIIYGAVTVVDADGRTTPATTTVQGRRIETRVSGAWLAAATYPVVVDPLIGTNFSIALNSPDERYVSAAFDPTRNRYGVFWEHVYSQNDLDVYGQLVSASGTLVGSRFPVRTSTAKERKPKAAFSTASDSFGVAMEYADKDVIWTRLNADGTIADTATYVDNNSQGTSKQPDVVWRQTQDDFLIVWSDTVTNNGNYKLYAERRNASNSAVLVDDFLLRSVSGVDLLNPDLAYNATRDEAFVSYESTNSNLFAFGFDGAVTGLTTGIVTVSSASGTQQLSAIVWNSFANEYMVVYQTSQSGANDIYGQRVAFDGTLVGSNTVIGAASGAEEDPEVVYNSVANRYFVVWDWQTADGDWDIMGQEVSATLTLVGSALAVSASPNSASNEVYPYVVFSPAAAEWLCGWHDGRNGSDFNIWAQRANATGATIQLLSYSDSQDPFSPDGNGIKDTTTFSATHRIGQFDPGSRVRTTVKVKDPVTQLYIRTMTDERDVPTGSDPVDVTVTLTWDGRNDGGQVVSDQTYPYEVTGLLLPPGGSSVSTSTGTGDSTVDTVVPTFSNRTPSPGGSTSDATPTISANHSDPAGVDTATFQLLVDGNDVTAQATVTGTGFTFTPSSNLADGSHAVSASIRDLAGNLGTTNWSFTVDTTGPSFANRAPAPDTSTNDATPTISADYSDPAGVSTSTFQLLVDGNDVTAQATVTGAGFTYTPSSNIAEGSHTVNASIQDTLGNVGSTSWSFTVDTTGPAFSNRAPAPDSSTSDATPGISADYSDPSGVNTSSFQLLLDGNDVTAQATVTGTGFTFTPSANLAEGSHTVNASIQDGLGNAGSTNWAFTVDTTGPGFSNRTPAPDSTTTDATPTIFADYSDPAGVNTATFQLLVDGNDVTAQATVTGTGFTYTPTANLADGSHSVNASIQDGLGNTGSTNWSFTVDTTGPTYSNRTPAPDSSTNDSTPLISADYADPDGVNTATFQLLVDGNDVTAQATATGTGFTFTPAANLAEGAHSVNASIEDNLGNAGTTNWSFTVDTTGPVFSNRAPAPDSSTNDSTPAISADYADASGVNTATFQLLLDGNDVTAQATVSGTGFTFTPSGALTDGSHAVSASIQDGLGNSGTTNWSFTVDTAGPTFTNRIPPPDSSTNDATPAISANYGDPAGVSTATFQLLLDGNDVTAQATVTGTGFTFTPSSNLAEGSHSVSASIEDTLGNSGTTTWSFSVNTTGPTFSNRLPSPGGSTNDPTPLISADYADPDGVNTATFQLLLDGNDVTAQATVTGTGFSFTPTTNLAEGSHAVDASIQDGLGNTGSTNWSFTVDTVGPEFASRAPTPASSTNDATPTISADYSDASGVNTATFQLLVDGSDVTAQATVTGTGFSYTPSANMVDGSHSVSASIQDGLGNVGTTNWSFTVDTMGPAFTNRTPPPDTATGDATPLISADYSDPAGVNTATLQLLLDGSDVTAQATVTGTGFTFTPSTALVEGAHTVDASIQDALGNSGSTTWSFTVELTPPRVLSVDPPNTTVGVAPETDVVLTFSEPIVVSTASDVLRLEDGAGAPISGTVALSQGNTVATFNPSASLALGTLYTVIVPNPGGGGVADAAGNPFDQDPSTGPLDPFTSQFSTQFSGGASTPILTRPRQNLKTYDNTVTVAGACDPSVTVQVLANGQLVATTSSDGSGLFSVETSPLPEGAYEVRARAVDSGGGASPLSTARNIVVDTTAPGTPTGVSVVEADGYCQLIWNPNQESDLLGYLVFRLGPGDSDFLQVTPLVLTSNAFRDTNVSNGQTYQYRVSAVDDAGPDEP